MIDFKIYPTKYATTAAKPPTNSISKPEKIQDRVEKYFLSAPITNNATPENTAATKNEFPILGKRYGRRGIRPAETKEMKVAKACFTGDSMLGANNPNSSCIIKSTQNFSLDEIRDTSFSKFSPEYPFFIKTPLISDNSSWRKP